jgi:hypothetical protein
MHAYHDTKTNTDHFDIYADAIQDGKVFDNHLDIFSCQVPHDSANVAADVRCTSRIVDVSALSPVASVTDFGVKAYWPKGSNTPVISMDTVGSGSEEGMLWSKDNGATWQVATWPSSDDSGMGYLINNFTMSSKDTCPFQASTDTNVSHFLNPPQIHCANLLHNVSTTDLTSYVLNAGDLAPEVRGPEMQYTTGLTGLWMFQKYSQNQNTYYIPFDQTQKQQEIPPAPGKGGLTQMPQFAIVSGANIKPAELVSCTFDSDLSLGAAVATTNGTKWSWKQQGTTVKQENIYDNDCRISMPDHSSTTVFDKPPFQNPRYDASSYVWLFAYQNI